MHGATIKENVARFNFCVSARPIVANSIRRFVCDIFFKVFTITKEIPALQNARSYNNYPVCGRDIVLSDQLYAIGRQVSLSEIS